MDISHWNSALWCVVMLICPGKMAKSEKTFTGVNTIIREYIGRTTTEKLRTVLTGEDVLTAHPGSTKPSWMQPHSSMHISKYKSGRNMVSTAQYRMRSSPKLNVSEDPPDQSTVTADPDQSTVTANPDQSTVTAGPVTEQPQEPSGVTVTPFPLNGSDHELFFNVTWDPPTGPKVHTYSLEVHSETNTIDCRLANFCYETDIPGDALWSAIPAQPSLDSDGCAVRPACAYLVKLIANTRDGHTHADVHVELDECVAGVCSCGHAPRLPTPVVSAKTIAIQGDLFVNVSWSLPVPLEPLRLPPRLRKKRYFISIGNLVKLVHTGPEWITHIVSPQTVDAYGFVVIPDKVQWRLLQISKRSDERFGARSGDGAPRRMGVDLKLVAHVSLEDERGCRGPAGNATVYDPNAQRPKKQVASGIHFQALWAVFGGACVLAMVTILAIGARAMKRVLKKFRPEPVVPASLQPLRPNWLQLDTLQMTSSLQFLPATL